MATKITKGSMKEVLAARYKMRTAMPADVTAQDMADLDAFLQLHAGAAKIFAAVNQDVHDRVATIKKANGRRLNAENEVTRVQSKLDKAVNRLGELMSIVECYKDDCLRDWSKLRANFFRLENSEILQYVKEMTKQYSDPRRQQEAN